MDKRKVEKKGKINNGKSVLITGASSGIGWATANYLAQEGFTVFAGIRKEADIEKIRGQNNHNLIPLYPLDMTEEEHIKKAYEFISIESEKRGEKGLYAIVNNAGGGIISPIELLDLGKLQTELETRILGAVSLVKTFLSIIRENHGRILWIVTPALIPTPFVSSIHICDFAVNCLARTLRIELSPWEISVVMIRCGGIKTPAVEKSYKELKESFKVLPHEKLMLYKDILEKEVKRLKSFDKGRTEPVEVAKKVYKALTVKKPKSRYRVGYMSGGSSFLELLPQPFVDWLMTKRLKK